MTETKWTPHQQLAINAAPGDTLLTAAAGAGKTAVLAARCIHLLADSADPCSIDELLVLTYTRAAAAEMRRRIALALYQRLQTDPADGPLRRQLALLDQADVCTIHSFCAGLLRQFFYRLPLDPAFAILEPDDAELIKLQVADELFEDCYAGLEPDFAEAFSPFVQLYTSGPDDRSLTQLLIKLHTFLDTLSQHQAWIQACRNDITAAHRQAGDVDLVRRQKQALIVQVDRTIARLQHALNTIEHFPHLAFYTDHVANELLPRLTRLARSLRSNDLAIVLDDLSDLNAFPRSPNRPKDLKENDIKPVKDLIDAAKKESKDTYSRYGASPDNIIRQIAHTEPFVNLLIELHREFTTRYEAVKHQQNVLDYADLEHKALQLLVGDSHAVESCDVALQLRSRYRHILVDEYQDISPVQEALLQLIARPDSPDSPGNLFMVGDVKQSIYGFRQADPEIFLRKYNQLPALEPDSAGIPSGKRISLNKNFRSRRGIINAVNYIFSRCMTAEFTGIAYDRRAQLTYGADCYDSDSRPVELHLVERTAAPQPQSNIDQLDPADIDATQREALVIAQRIRRIIADAQPIVDPQTHETRPVQYRDIVVLLRSMKNRAEHWTETFQQHHIPVHAELSTGYFIATEIQDMISLLTVLDNSQQDISLAGVLRGPILRLDESQLTEIRLHCPDQPYHQAVLHYSRTGPDQVLAERLRDFLTRLNNWRTAARRGPLADLIWRIYRQTQLLAYVRPLPHGGQRHSNLLHLYDRARQFDSFSQQGLARFLRFLEKLRAEEGDFGPAPILTESDNVVRIMSIHKSKGLEFPIVIVADLARRFNLSDARSPILFDRPDSYPVALPIVDPATHDRWSAVAHHIIADNRLGRALAEEMRILYVAFTRAREHLILTAAVDLEKLVTNCQPWCFDLATPLPEFFLRSAASPIDWLAPALAAHPDLQDLFEPTDTTPTDPFEARFCATTYSLDDLTALLNGAHPTPSRPPTPESLDDLLPKDVPSQLTPDAQAVIDRLNWQYPHRALADLEARTSVTDLKHRLDMDRDPEFIDSPGAAPIDPEAIDAAFASRPGFLAQAPQSPSPTDIGSWTHEFLQRLDLQGPLDQKSLAQQLQGFGRSGFFSEQQISCLDLGPIARFFQTPLAQQMLSHRHTLQREWSFTLAIPAHQAYYNIKFDPGDADEPVLVRGIIDVLFETPAGLVIIDYKTDRVTAAQAPQRAQAYFAPMLLYRRAVQTILGKTVAEMHLHFLTPATTIPVPS